VNHDLVLVPEVEARRALRGRRIRIQMVAPIGAWVGCGKLRVLRLTLRPSTAAQDDMAQGDAGDAEEIAELAVGYEAYRQ